MSGTPSPRQSSSSGSAASFIKGVQQLIQSDDDEIIMAKMHSLHTTFPLLKKINNQMTNGEKLVLFMRDHQFRHRLGEKLLEKFGSQKIPTIKVELYSIRFRSIIQEELDETDLVKILQKFGKISIISVDKTFAYLRFQSLPSSYLAIQILNEFQIVSDLLRLSVRWCKPDEQLLAEQLFSAKFNSITKAFGNHQTAQKYNAKYQIHLACPPEFKLPQKIIGPKGNNIKKIFELISQEQKIASIEEIQKNLKLRLRGKGSGYSQGPDGEESDEILNLCISSKEKKLYDSGCSQIERILQKLANDYKFEFQRTYRRLLEGTIYKKYELQGESYKVTNELKLEQLPNNLNDIDESRAQKLSIKEIQEQINLRNKARKNGNYKQADQIREKLKKRGILLTDGTGKKNFYSTTWSYIGETGMVQLEFNVEVSAPFQEAWKYFGNFENITDWDPNTTGMEVVRKNQNEIGSVYNILSVFNGKESTVTYETMEYKQTKDRGYINLQGKNSQITAKDEIICARRGPNTTLVTYRADICLRGILCLFTPFIKSGLNQIAEQAKNGCIKRSREKWGKAEAVV